MAHVQLGLADGRMAEFPAAPPGRMEDTCFILGIRKCGSSLLNSLCADLAGMNGRHFLDIAGRFFQSDVPERSWRNDPASLALLVAGQVHGGFRAMPLIFASDPIFLEARKILMVRDPRDALVSEYFSNAYSHALPEIRGAGATQDLLTLRRDAVSAALEATVLHRAAALNQTYMEYAGILADPCLKLFRYEDVILAKRQWVHDIAAHFGWAPPDAGTLTAMMGWADVIPAEEKPGRFIRKVVSGDHRAKLSPAIITRLNVALAPAMGLFGYA
jgi:hypothetical protein